MNQFLLLSPEGSIPTILPFVYKNLVNFVLADGTKKSFVFELAAMEQLSFGLIHDWMAECNGEVASLLGAYLFSHSISVQTWQLGKLIKEHRCFLPKYKFCERCTLDIDFTSIHYEVFNDLVGASRRSLQPLWSYDSGNKI